MTTPTIDADVFDMDRIKELKAELARFDAMDLFTAKVKRNGRHYSGVPERLLNEFMYTGLRNVDLEVFWDAEEDR